MLKPAQLYTEELKRKYIETWYQPEYMYYSAWVGTSELKIPENTYDSHDFASVDKDNNVIGYISYSTNYITMSAYNLGAINFYKGNVEFAKDLYQVICDIFCKYNFNRLSWCCVISNPAIRGYRNFIKKHGGKESAYRRQVAKLQDGKLYDEVEFEILAKEFH